MADAPMPESSTRSTIESGIMFTSTEASAPVPPKMKRRPFNSTSVRSAPRPRRLIRPAPKPLLSLAPRVAPVCCGSFCSVCARESAGRRSKSAWPTTRMGPVASSNDRSICEPVTMTSSMFAAAAALSLADAALAGMPTATMTVPLTTPMRRPTRRIKLARCINIAASAGA